MKGVLGVTTNSRKSNYPKFVSNSTILLVHNSQPIMLLKTCPSLWNDLPLQMLVESQGCRMDQNLRQKQLLCSVSLVDVCSLHIQHVFGDSTVNVEVRYLLFFTFRSNLSSLCTGMMHPLVAALELLILTEDLPQQVWVCCWVLDPSICCQLELVKKKRFKH